MKELKIQAHNIGIQMKQKELEQSRHINPYPASLI